MASVDTADEIIHQGLYIVDMREANANANAGLNLDSSAV